LAAVRFTVGQPFALLAALPLLCLARRRTLRFPWQSNWFQGLVDIDLSSGQVLNLQERTTPRSMKARTEYFHQFKEPDAAADGFPRTL
jgi:hypothetical protein